MLRKACVAAMFALSLGACGVTGPGTDTDSYTLRPDLCQVLDYQPLHRRFGEMGPYGGDSIGDAKVACVRHGNGFSGTNVTTRVEAFKYESPQEAKEVFERFAKAKSNADGKLKADVDDVRFYDGNAVLVLDGDLYLKVLVSLEGTDDGSYGSELPALTAGLADQALQRLREKS